MMEKTTDVSNLWNNQKFAVLVERGAGDEIVDAGELGKFYRNDKIYYPSTAEGVIELAIKVDQDGKPGMWFIPGIGYGNFLGDRKLTKENILFEE